MAEISGSLGDLGTFLPHVVGAITVAGLAPAGILLGFGLFLIGSGAFYGLPIPVQPMKAVSAVLLTEGLSAGEIAASGLMLGLVSMLGASGRSGGSRASSAVSGPAARPRHRRQCWARA